MSWWDRATTEERLAQIDGGLLVYRGQAEKSKFTQIWLPIIRYLAERDFTARQVSDRLGIPLANIFAVSKRHGVSFKSVYNTNGDEEAIADALTYEPETGKFYWKKDRGSQHLEGKEAGTISHGYVAISFRGKVYRAHRLAWFFVHGKWPEKLIDHIDRNRSNNRIANLRECDNSGNQWNRTPNDRNLPRGVIVDKRNGRFIAQCKREGRTAHVGCFSTADEAHAAYVAVAVESSKGFYAPEVAFKRPGDEPLFDANYEDA